MPCAPCNRCSADYHRYDGDSGRCRDCKTKQIAVQEATLDTAKHTAQLVSLLEDMKKRAEQQDARMLKMEQFVVATHDQLQLLLEVSKGTLLDESETEPVSAVKK
jgi:hypothetical protein